jgi:hypothetical protein
MDGLILNKTRESNGSNPHKRGADDPVRYKNLFVFEKIYFIVNSA